VTTQLLVVHLGGPKCGSSSIQSALTASPTMRLTAGGVGEYGVLTPEGALITGDQVADAFRSSWAHQLYGYMNSVNGTELSRCGSNAATLLRAYSERKPSNSLFLSNEGWLANPDVVQQYIVSGWKGVVRLLVFVRPQIDYLNAAWWQWGAWQGTSFDRWLEEASANCAWFDRLEPFTDLVEPAELRVHVLDSKVVDRSMSALGVEPDAVQADTRNRSLPASVLRMLQRHRERLRPGPDNSEIDFVLERHVTWDQPPPFVMTREVVAQLVAAHRASNERLLRLMDSGDREKMRSDDRWWTADAYADRSVSDPEPQPPDAEAADGLAADLAAALLETTIRADESEEEAKALSERLEQTVSDLERTRNEMRRTAEQSAAVRARLKSRVQRYETSASWRVTAPLRSIGGLMRSGRRRR